MKSKVIPDSVFYLEIESFFHGFLLRLIDFTTTLQCQTIAESIVGWQLSFRNISLL